MLFELFVVEPTLTGPCNGGETCPIQTHTYINKTLLNNNTHLFMLNAFICASHIICARAHTLRRHHKSCLWQIFRKSVFFLCCLQNREGVKSCQRSPQLPTHDHCRYLPFTHPFCFVFWNAGYFVWLQWEWKGVFIERCLCGKSEGWLNPLQAIKERKREKMTYLTPKMTPDIESGWESIRQ